MCALFTHPLGDRLFDVFCTNDTFRIFLANQPFYFTSSQLTNKFPRAHTYETRLQGIMVSNIQSKMITTTAGASHKRELVIPQTGVLSFR